jgi:hypothetical protein
MKSIVSATMLLLVLPARLGGRDAIKLKTGEGLETVEQNCATCHSLDYIQMNSVFLD